MLKLVAMVLDGRAAKARQSMIIRGQVSLFIYRSR
jgi:hypothetical protein